MKYNMTWVCGELGLQPDISCKQEFYKNGFEGSEGVPDALVEEVKAQIVPHLQNTHGMKKDKTDQLSSSFLKKALASNAKYKEVKQ